ncbi:MAG: signal recognition particle-docking protein FtsY [Polyangiaceae bacterium]|nr:signal recognition particle-docking protein FtsY [Polyangiaceae bacterium]
MFSDEMYVWIALGLLVAIVLFLVLRPKSADKNQEEQRELPSRVGAPKASPEEAGDRVASVKLPSAQTSAYADPAEARKLESLPKTPVKKPVSAEVPFLRKGLTATRGGLIAKLSDLLKGKKEIPDSIVHDIEQVLLSSDVGAKTTSLLLDRISDSLKKKELADSDAVWAKLREESLQILMKPAKKMASAKPTVILMVGVNGVGKTTTIGKLATKWSAQGKSVVLAAGDTFRAAAVAQLEVWGKRVGCEVVKGKEGADPGAVAFEATTRALELGSDVLLIDTAGRLHTKTPLMDEIKKVRRSIGKSLEGAPHETWLILDATTGQNGLQQAIQFKDAVELSGIVLTKLDGTAKGGVLLAICEELNLPVRYVGLGERAEDLREFDAEEFVTALFDDDDGQKAA